MNGLTWDSVGNDLDHRSPANVLSLEGAGCFLVILSAEWRGNNRIVLHEKCGCFAMHATLRSPLAS